MIKNKLSRRKVIKYGAAAAVIGGAAPISARSGKHYDAIVVGAGLSGLQAAMILEESGLNVLVLEGRNRVGGRVYSLMDVPGKPEAAGQLIGASYARMRTMVDRFDLEYFSPAATTDELFDFGWMYKIKGETIFKDQWESHSLNPMEGDNRKIPPHQMLWTIANQDNPLKGHAYDAWLTPEFAKYDIPFDQYLRNRGINEETIRLMDVIIHANHITGTSALNELRRYHVNSSGSRPFDDGKTFKQIKGGNAQLPVLMAQTLKNEPLLGKSVVQFEQTPTSVTLSCADGTEYTADNVVCSIPISLLRDVTFYPRLTPHMTAQFEEMDYGISVGVHYLVKERFWEKDGLPTGIWTDGPLERVVVSNYGKDQQPTIQAYINGETANKFRFMSDDEIFKYVEQQMVDIRPSIKGTLEPIIVQSCERDIHGAGDWVYWQPGQVSKYGKTMRDRHGRIHFCGEHTAIMQRGMEGAFESGERAALDILLS